MANALINSTLLSKEAALEFELANTFIATANRKYDGMWGDNTYDAGDSVNIRLDNSFLVKRGDTVTVGDVKESSAALTLQELYSVPVTYTTTDLSTKMRAASWMDRVFRPAVRGLVGEVNKDIAAQAALSTYIHTGVPGTSINTFAAVDLVGAAMIERGMPVSDDWYMNLAPRQASALKSALQNSFNTTLNTEISMRSQLGHLSYFDMYTDQAIADHTPYTAGVMTATSMQVNAEVTAGATIVVKGMTASKTGIFKAGDVIEIAGVYSVNRVTRQSTGQPMQFVVTVDADSTAGGLSTLTISPTIISDVANPNRNVSGAVLVDSVVKVNGVTGAVAQVAHKVNVAYTKSALHVVTPSLAPLDGLDSSVFKDPKTGLSLRVSKSSEILDNRNVLRIDLLCGYLWLGQQAIRVIS